MISVEEKGYWPAPEKQLGVVRAVTSWPKLRRRQRRRANQTQGGQPGPMEIEKIKVLSKFRKILNLLKIAIF